ncbi:MAG TPA: heme-binding beta-barrel domain-containing protein, partial [Acidimicrobiia bacterium]|nr:heme-binding beta-barrel domain-containing protein [Acidimicrobiia bacterium]
GLRYHTHIVKPGEVETFHDQVGYWLWEPAARIVTHTLAIPRGQVLLASGRAAPDAKTFEVVSELGSATNGIVSNPFLDRAFRTESFRMRVMVNDDGTWSYEEHTMLRIPDRDALVDHVDRNTLRRVGEPTPNPLAAAG